MNININVLLDKMPCSPVYRLRYFWRILHTASKIIAKIEAFPEDCNILTMTT